MWLDEAKSTLMMIGNPVAGYGPCVVARNIPEEASYPCTDEALFRVAWSTWRP